MYSVCLGNDQDVKVIGIISLKLNFDLYYRNGSNNRSLLWDDFVVSHEMRMKNNNIRAFKVPIYKTN